MHLVHGVMRTETEMMLRSLEKMDPRTGKTGFVMIGSEKEEVD